MFTFKTIAKTETGRKHSYQGKANQDAVQVYETSDILMLCLTDGCSGSRYPEKAAQICLKTAVTFVNARGIWELSEKEFKKKAAGSFNMQLAESGYPVEELCATIAMVMIHKKSGEFIAFSVGDSAVLVLDEDLTARPLLRPVNGTRKTQTIFVNDPAAIIRLSCYSRGRIAGGASAFVLYTDGADRIAEPPYTEAQQLSAALLLSEDAAETCIREIIEQAAEINPDDITVAAVCTETAKTRAAAYASWSGKLPDDAPAPAHPNIGPFSAAAPDVPGRTKRASIPFSSMRTKPQKPHSTQSLPPLLQFMQTPRTASEIISQSSALTEQNFMDTMLALLRLGLVSVQKQADGTVCFVSENHF